ncbi:MAG: flagellar biosynthesis protein FlhA [Armatimonadia bacterium]|nr:flagellar biosynthesis protein FlhA [Armatimonadia bacterium]
MAAQTALPTRGLQFVGRISDFLPGVIFVVIVTMLIVPMPPVILDLLLGLNIIAAMGILVATTQVTRPLQLSVFPSLLLVATLFRLSLNVAAARLILSQGDEPYGAGHLIDQFGQWVIAGNQVVGIIIFAILVVIQFVVITNGAGRVAEVAARFTLDAMPGKQMAIDADLNAGIIDETQARDRRQEIQREADFYGAMDGSAKFVRGDAIAAIVIVLVNIVGGLIIGRVYKGLELGEAFDIYTRLTIGEGLVTQIPALLVSTATGVIVTRAASDANLGREMHTQLTAYPRAITVAGGAVAVFGMVLAVWPVIIAGAVGVAVGTMLERGALAPPPEETEEGAEEREAPTAPEDVHPLLTVEPIELSIGYGLVALAHPDYGGDLLDRITMIRKQTALDLGLVVPPIRIRDNLQLEPNQYAVNLRGVQVAQGEVITDRLMVIGVPPDQTELHGVETQDPAFGLSALWITDSERELAESMGYTVVDATCVIGTHLTEVIQRHAAEILGRQEVQNLLDHVAESHPAAVQGVVPDVLSVAEMHRILQGLLAERVSIRDMVTILETLADRAAQTRDPDELVEQLRYALRRRICTQHAAEDGKLKVITLDPRIERAIMDSMQRTAEGTVVALDPDLGQAMLQEIAKAIQAVSSQGYEPVLVCADAIRLPLRRLTESVFEGLTILAMRELVPDITIERLGTVSLPQ